MQLSSNHSNRRRPLRATLAALAVGMMSNLAFAETDIVVRYIPVDPQSALTTMSISADARYAVYRFSSQAHVVVHDLVDNTLVKATLLPDGTPAANPQCTGGGISADAHYVLFACEAAQMGTAPVAGGRSFYVYDRINNKTEVMPVTTSATVVESMYGGINGNGRYIAYRTAVASTYRMYVRDMVNKTTVETTAQFINQGSRGNDTNISDDGRYISYSGFGAAGATIQGLSVYDTVSGVTQPVNVNAAGVPSAIAVVNVSMSADGNILAFQSSDNKLTTPAAQAGLGVYVRDRRAGKTEFISAGVSILSSNVTVSPNGRYVAYIGIHDTNFTELYVHDRYTKITRIVPGAFQVLRSATIPKFSADGRYLVFHSINTSTKAHFIGVADLGEAAGVSLSSSTLTLTEGGEAATYTMALTRAPVANVTVAVKPDAQLSVARSQLVFTPDNWSVPQVVSVQALQDGVAEGPHSGTVTHSVSSADAEFAVVAPMTVTATITDGVAPTLVVPALSWNRSDMPLSGTAAPGATVLLTAVNRNTGWLSSVSAVADAQGRWSHTMTGFTDGVIDLDAQADGLKSVVRTVTVTLTVVTPPPTFIDVTGYIRTLAFSLGYNRATGKYAGDFILTNTGSIPLAGPLHLQLNNLTGGVSLFNATGNHDGAAYITVPAGLQPDASVTIPLVFDNPSRGAIDYDAKIFSGTF